MTLAAPVQPAATRTGHYDERGGYWDADGGYTTNDGIYAPADEIAEMRRRRNEAKAHTELCHTYEDTKAFLKSYMR
jgi:hypothetical protein